VPKVNLDKHFEAVTPRWQPLLIGACFCTALDCNEAKGAWKWLWKRLVGNEALQEALGKKDDVSFGERAGDHEGVAVKAYEWISQCAQRDEEPWVSFRKDSLTEYEMAVVLSLFSIRFQGMSGEVEARDLLDLLPSGAALFDQCLKTSKNVARLRDLGWVRFIGVAPGPPGPLEGEYTLSQRAWKELSRATECPCPSEDVPEGTQLDTATLSDLILDERTWWALKDAADAWTKERDARGKWVGPPTFLLHGPPGTGKSLAARALAGTLGLPVHSISLAQTLGRYIGETEKSLGKSFQAAEEAGALLVLDEADTFIWDRADTNWAWERSHTNAILQLLDARTVPVVFTTNLGQRIDPAIQRRLQVVVEFPLPDRPCRERLWRLHLDRFEWGKVLLAVPLSKIVLTGALIANSVHAADRALRIGRVMQGNLTPWLIEEARRQATRLPACAKSLRFVGFRP
jgi:adenylate kinase family enzyme